MSRSDVALHEANKNDEDAHAGTNGAAADADGADSEQQNKSCWSFLMCCFATKKTTAKGKEPPYKAGDKKTGKNEAGITMAVNKPDEKSAASSSAAAGGGSGGGGGGGAASLVTQVQQGADAPVVQPVAFPVTRPPAAKCLLGPLADHEKGMKTLVLDLDETLVHSSFKPIANPDFVISIELENVIHRVYVLKRPGVDQFLRAVGQKFEVVVFTASLAKYADPLLDILDRSKVVKTRLFREACVHHYGNYVKDLSHLGRRLEDTIIIDNSPFSYMFQPDNAIPISSWFNDKNDRQLYELLPFLDQLTTVDDVCTLLHTRKQQQLAAGTNMA